MYESLIFIGAILLTQVVKKFIKPRFGSTGVHVFTFIIALIGNGVYLYSQTDPEFALIIQRALEYLAGTVAVYEVILKKIGFPTVEKQLQK